MVVHIRMHRCELLKRLHLSEAEHNAFFSAEEKMRILDPIIEPASDFPTVFDARISHGSKIGFEAVGHDLNRTSIALQRLLEEAQSSRIIPFLGDIAFQDFTLVINGSPQVMRLSIDLHEDFINVPTPICIALHAANPLAFDVSREHRAKPVPPQPHRLMVNVDSTLEQQIVDDT